MAFNNFLNEHIENLQIEGDLAVGNIDSTDKFLEFRSELRKFGFTYTTRSSRKENYSWEDGPKKRMPGRGSLMYKSTSDVSVPFFGRPFVVETTIYYTCSQGLKYYASKRYPDEMFVQGDPLAKRRRRPKATQKIGCQARMTVKKIRVFTADEYYVRRDNWREKKAAIDSLRNDLQQNNPVDSFIRYYLLISMDSVHNHEPSPKLPPKKKPPVNPAKKVIRLQASLMEALTHLNSGFVSKCTNIATLVQCCNNLKTIINSLTVSIENNDGISGDLVEQAKTKIEEKQLKCCINAEKRSDNERKRKCAHNDIVTKAEPVPEEPVAEDPPIIEVPTTLDGGQMIWDGINVSYVLDGQSIVMQQEAEDGRDSKHIFLQRNPTNLGVISQGGQNYAIVQHGSMPNVQMSAPFTLAKIVTPTILPSTSSPKKSKKNDGGAVTLSIPAGVDWNQQNWGQQIVLSGEQFASQPIWNITQPQA